MLPSVMIAVHSLTKAPAEDTLPDIYTYIALFYNFVYLRISTVSDAHRVGIYHTCTYICVVLAHADSEQKESESVRFYVPRRAYINGQ